MSVPLRPRNDSSINRVADEFHWALQDRWLDPRLDDEGNAAWVEALDSYARRARRVKLARLSRQGHVTRELLLDSVDYQLRHVLGGYLEEELNSMDSVMLSVWNWTLVAPKQSVGEWREIIARLCRSDSFVDEYVGLLRRGLDSGRVQPAPVVRSCIDVLGTLSSRSPRRNTLLKLQEELEQNLAGRKPLPRLRRELEDALYRITLPAHGRLRRFLQGSYLPRAPRRPGNVARYRHHLRFHLGSGYDLERLMLGASRDVETLHRQLAATARRVDRGVTSLPAFMRALNRQRESRYRSPEELLDDARAKVDEARTLARDMAPIPANELTVTPVPPTREGIVEAVYMSTDARSGEFQLNTGKLFDRNKRYDMATMATHETYGGHHLQNVYAQKQTSLPAFRRDATFLVYDEGWAMYAEHWRDARRGYAPYDRIGYLMQAIRGSAMAVVDVGVNTGIMTPGQGCRYLAGAIFGSPRAMKPRIERILNWPGQGATYYVGKREILRSRDEARRVLGRNFDERAFHQKVLNLGSVPPKTLRREVEDWARRSLARRRR